MAHLPCILYYAQRNCYTVNAYVKLPNYVTIQYAFNAIQFCRCKELEEELEDARESVQAKKSVITQLEKLVEDLTATVKASEKVNADLKKELDAKTMVTPPASQAPSVPGQLNFLIWGILSVVFKLC